MPNIEINIDLDKKCAECGKAGAMDSGICMKCVIPAMQGKLPEWVKKFEYKTLSVRGR